MCYVPLLYYYCHFMALWTLSSTTWVSWYLKKHSLTHTYCDRQASLICFLHLLRSMASFLFKLLRACLFPQSLGLASSTSYSMYSFTQSLASFHRTCPYYHNLFCCSTKIMSSNPSLSVNPFLRTLSFSLTPQIHLTILISTH